MKNIVRLLIYTILINSCSTVYNLNDHGYFIEKNNKIEEFNYKGKDRYRNGYDIYSLDTLLEDYYYPDKGEKSKAKFEFKKKCLIYKTYSHNNTNKDTIWLDTSKMSICEKMYPFFNYCGLGLILNNGQPLCYNDDVFPKKINYLVKYKGDSTFAFNNQPAVKCHIFEYYKNTEGITNDFTQPVQFLVSSEDGMMLEVTYCEYWDEKEHWFCIRVIDYRKFLFANPIRLKRFLM